MITFSSKRQAFIKMMRAKMPIENTREPSKAEGIPDETVDDELMALLEKKFHELFGPIDDDD